MPRRSAAPFPIDRQLLDLGAGFAGHLGGRIRAAVAHDHDSGQESEDPPNHLSDGRLALIRG